jgi:hypothetical protein
MAAANIDYLATLQKVSRAFELCNTDGWDEDLEHRVVKEFTSSGTRPQTLESFAEYLIEALALWEMDGFEREILMEVLGV